MEPIKSSETSAYINTLTPGTYPKEKKVQSKHGESLKSRIFTIFIELEIEALRPTQASTMCISVSQRDTPLPSDIYIYADTSPGQINQYPNRHGIHVIAVEGPVICS